MRTDIFCSGNGQVGVEKLENLRSETTSTLAELNFSVLPVEH